MDLDQIEKLLAMLSENDVNEFSYKGEDFNLRLRLGEQVVAAPPAPVQPVVHAPAAPAATPAPAPAREAEPAPAAEDTSLATVESPMVGTFYRAPSPGAPPFIEVGARVSSGQTLCIVEAMKLMNEIEAEVAGEIVEVCVEDAQPVQFGQALFKIRPA